jgi:hypothetical protein
MTKRLLIAGIVFVFLTLLTVSVIASSSGPEDGMTGAPGLFERHCVACHYLNDPGNPSVSPNNNNLTITLLDGNVAVQQYTPEKIYTVRVSLQRQGQRRWGFELTCLPDAQGSNALTAGQFSLNPNEQRVQMSYDFVSKRYYVKHTRTGTNAGTTTGATWEFKWQAPSRGTGTVTFYAGGNAANNNNEPSGDYVFKATLSMQESPSTAVEQAEEIPSAFRLEQNYPNPFNPRTSIRFRVSSFGFVSLKVYNLLGQEVATLVNDWKESGNHSVAFDIRHSTFDILPSGVYFYRLEAGGFVETKRMLLVK